MTGEGALGGGARLVAKERDGEEGVLWQRAVRRVRECSEGGREERQRVRQRQSTAGCGGVLVAPTVLKEAERTSR